MNKNLITKREVTSRYLDNRKFYELFHPVYKMFTLQKEHQWSDSHVIVGVQRQTSDRSPALRMTDDLIPANYNSKGENFLCL